MSDLDDFTRLAIEHACTRLSSQPFERTLPAAIGHYDDEFVRTAAGFRIARRVLQFAFRDPSAFPGA